MHQELIKYFKRKFQSDLSDGSLSLAAPTLSAALLGFLLLLGLGYLLYVRHSIFRLILICRSHTCVSEGQAATAAAAAAGRAGGKTTGDRARAHRHGWQMSVHAHARTQQHRLKLARLIMPFKTLTVHAHTCEEAGPWRENGLKPK